jgi:prepilin-type N-terminal cleavage/methylation domain-containing protein
MKRQGFTLVELAIVICIIALIATVGVASFNSYRGVKLEAGAKKIAADLLYVRSLSISMAKWYGVTFEVDPANNYYVYQTNGSADAAIDNPSSTGSNFVVNFSNVTGGVVISSVNIAGGNKVEFHPWGTPYNDRNGLPLTTTGSITVSYNGLSRVINILPDTGLVQIQ